MSVRPTAQRKLEPNVERSYITSAGHVHTVKIKEVLVNEEVCLVEINGKEIHLPNSQIR